MYLTENYIDNIRFNRQYEEISKFLQIVADNGELVGAVVYDTDYNDRWYIIHSISDESLLGQMIEYVTEADVNTTIINA